MSLTFEQGLAAPVRHFLVRIVDGLMEVRDRQRRHFAIRRTRRKLHELPDWILRDIGITRGTIHDVAAIAYDRPGVDPRRAWRVRP